MFPEFRDRKYDGLQHRLLVERRSTVDGQRLCRLAALEKFRPEERRIPLRRRERRQRHLGL